VTNGLRIRTAVPEDFATLLAIDQSCFEDSIAYDSEELDHYMNLPSASTLVAEIGSQIVGFLLADAEQSWEGKHTAVLITLDVVEAGRRRGIGTALLERSEQILKSSRIARYRLQVDTTNQAAIDFYVRSGFKELGTLEDYYGEGRDAYLMEKVL
jgi:ribosomal-protein-alanine N-acetyltransferase